MASLIHKNMQKRKIFFRVFVVAGIAAMAQIVSCKKEVKADPNAPVITISQDKITGKTAQLIFITVNMTASNGIKELQISKGVNLVTDSGYGVNGVLTVLPEGGSSTNFQYQFSYLLDSGDVDKLVGFNYKLIDNKGLTAEKDLTVTSLASAAQTLYSYKWNFISKKVMSINFESIKTCQKDNIFMYRKDSSASLDYGTNACSDDSSIVYFKWFLSNDEKTFTQLYYPKDYPDSVRSDVYTVISISNKKLVTQNIQDLTSSGLGDSEVVQYTYNALSY